MEHGGPFDISSRSGGNLEPIAVCQENPTFELAPTSKGSASAHSSLIKGSGAGMRSGHWAKISGPWALAPMRDSHAAR
jgi:hypothetical protein